MPAPPLVRLAELEIELEHLEAYLALLAEEIEASVSQESGVLALSAVALRDSPTSLRLLEVYADEAAYRTHLLAPHFLRYKAATSSMIRSLRLLEADPVLLRSKRQGDVGTG